MKKFEPTVLALGDALRSRGERMAAAESCTGGLIAAACTSVAGSSDWFDRGFVTYSNDAKVQMLGVSQATLDAHGAVSEAVAREMADGALRHSAAQIAVAVTGIAGPGGATPAKPVGLVCIALAARGIATSAASHHFAGDRTAVREATVDEALRRLLEAARRA